jgi:hypothetical protein
MLPRFHLLLYRGHSPKRAQSPKTLKTYQQMAYKTHNDLSNPNRRALLIDEVALCVR